MRGREILFGVLALGLLAGCGGPYVLPILPPPHRDQVFASYEKTWQALIRALAKENVPLRAVAKDSGVIASDDFLTPVGVYADCGRFGDSLVDGEALITFTLFVQAVGSNGTDVQINSRMRTHRKGPLAMFMPFESLIQCASTGRWESNLLDTIRRMVNN